MIDELIDGVVGFLIFLTERGVDTGPVVEPDSSLVDLLHLEETVSHLHRLALGGDDLRGG